MAFNDYRYIGYEDEIMITELLLAALPKVCQARVDRQKWIESIHMSAPDSQIGICVQSSNKKPVGQCFVEYLESDKILCALIRIEVRLSYAIRCLPVTQRNFVRLYYFTPWKKDRTNARVARRLGISNPNTVNSLRARVVKRLAPVCIELYKDFCEWRYNDDVDLQRRKAIDFAVLRAKFRKNGEPIGG